MSTLQEKIAVMQAAAEGKAIQVKVRGLSCCGWSDTDCPGWDWYMCDYRVKKEKKTIEVRVNVYPSCVSSTHHATKEAADDRHARAGRRIACVKLTGEYEV